MGLGNDDLDVDKFKENLQQLNSVLGATRASFDDQVKAMVKAKLLQDQMQKKEEDEFELIRKKLGIDQDEFELKKKKLEQDAREYLEDERRAKQRAKTYQDLVTGAFQAAGAMVNVASSSVSVAQGVANSNKAFTSVEPTLELVGNTIKTAIGAISSALSSLPVVGQIMGGINAVAGVAVDMVVNTAKMQLELDQKMMDNFASLAKVGATFGGSLTDAVKSAHTFGLSLDTYANFVSSHAAALATVGMSVSESANTVLGFSKHIAENNTALLGMLGSYDALNEATLDYASFMSGLGVDVVKNQNSLKQSAAGVVMVFKSLQDITGENLEALKKEREARLQDTNWRLYQLELEKKSGPESVARVDAAMSLQKKIVGDQGAKAIQDFIEHHGQMMNADNLMWAQQHREELEAGVKLIKSAEKSSGDLTDESKRYAKTIAGVTDQRGVEVSRTGATSFGGSNDAYVKMQQETWGKEIEARTMLTTMQEKGFEVQKIQNAEEAESHGKLIKKNEEVKSSLDDLTRDSLPKMADLTNTMMDIQRQLITNILPHMTEATGMFTDMMHGIADKMGWEWNENGSGGTNNNGPAEAGKKGVVDQRQADAINTARDEKEVAKSEGYKKFRESKGYATEGWKANYGVMAGEASVEEYLKTQNSQKVKLTIPEDLKQSKDAQSGGGSDPRMQAMLDAIGKQYPGGRVTALNDSFHQDREKANKHKEGKAVDFALPPNLLEKDGKPSAKTAEQVKAFLTGLGFKYVQDEYHDPSPGATGGHIHAQLKNGGITNGPSLAGEAGTEAVVPLPDGRTIPVKLDNSALIDKMDEMISILKDHKDISQKHLWAAS